MKLGCAVLLLAAGTVTAQQPAFKTGVEVVSVPVSVLTRDHNNGLTVADFELAENGERQQITTVVRERRPVSLAIVVDSSGSMAIGIRKELAIFAVQRAVEALLPDDEIAVVLFGEKVETRLPWTRVGAITSLNWSGWVPYGMTPLNDGMKLGLALIEQAHNPRRAVMLVTDGFENASRESTSALVKTRQQSETTIYGIGVGSASLADLRADAGGATRIDRESISRANAGALGRVEAATPGASPLVRPPQALPNFDYLETLVGDSGGAVHRVLSQPETAMAAKNIVGELQNEYLLGYTPARPLDGKYRRLKVEVKRRGVFVRHRGGYLALPSGNTQ